MNSQEDIETERFPKAVDINGALCFTDNRKDGPKAIAVGGDECYTMPGARKIDIYVSWDGRITKRDFKPNLKISQKDVYFCLIVHQLFKETRL